MKKKRNEMQVPVILPPYGPETERRTFRLKEVRVLDGDADAPARIEGYAALFGELSEDLGEFREIIEPGFFEAALDDDVRALFNHDSNYVLGRTGSGTLALEEDETGLEFSVTPPETTWASDLLTTMRRGDVDQMSFGFTVREGGDRWNQNENGTMVRTLLRGGCENLYDISPVTFPAYPQTSAQVRARLANPAEPLVDGRPAEPPETDPQGRNEVLRRRLELAEVETDWRTRA